MNGWETKQHQAASEGNNETREEPEPEPVMPRQEPMSIKSILRQWINTDNPKVESQWLEDRVMDGRY